MLAMINRRVQSSRFKVQGWLRLSSKVQGSFSTTLSIHGLLRGSFLAVAGLSWPTLPRRSLFNFIALLLLFTPSLAFAQPGDLSITNGASWEVLTPVPDSGWLVTLAQKEPWVTTVLALMGALRLLLKPIFAALHAFALTTGNERVEAMAARIAGSRGLRIFAFVLDWVASVKLVPPVRTVIGDPADAAGAVAGRQSSVISSPTKEKG